MNIDIKKYWNLNCPNRVELWHDPLEQDAFKAPRCALGRTKKVFRSSSTTLNKRRKLGSRVPPVN